jgi:putative ABC transport system permease protein
MAVAVLTGSMWTFGATDALINYTFYQSARQDASIGFSGPKPLSALFAVARLPGILHAEPFRAVSVIIRHGPIERRTGLMGQLATADLTRVVDARGALVDLPASGLVISSALARILGVQQGDTVAVSLLEGDRRTVDVPISATIESYLGLTAFMNFDALNRLLGEGEMISGVNVSVDNARETQLFSALKATPSASAISLQRVSLQQYRDTLAANISVMITIYVSFAGIIAFGVIYSFARISLSEQGREFASLRVLGFSTAEVSALLLGEIGIVVLIAQPIGWLIGLGVARLAADSFSTELYRVPLVVGPEVYATASLVSITAAIISGFVVRRRIDRLDMIAVLKTRE